MLLHAYTNGNTKVTIFDDGTKERVYDETPLPVHPESLDVKITNYCDLGCAFCHEQSTKSGQHADITALCNVLSPLPAGVEIAIGGGNPLSHPQLLSLLQALKIQGLIANITINERHIKPYFNLIQSLITNKFVHGVGLSQKSKTYLEDIKSVLTLSDNVVIHQIVGINNVDDIDGLISVCSDVGKQCKILALGYKQFGFGINYYDKNKSVEENKFGWYTKLPLYFKRSGVTLSFDNLAIQQLNLQRFFSKESWNRFYMGDDFIFTMYIDAVKKQLAASSTATNRVPFSRGLLNYFQEKK